jgi:valyl-tRNA synthetase
VKVDLNGADQERKETAINVLYDVLKKTLIMLFPYAPFIAEEIYSYLPGAKKSIYEEKYPEPLKKTFRHAELGEDLTEMVKLARQYKADKKLPPAYKLELAVCGDKKTSLAIEPYLTRLAFASSYTFSEKGDASYRFFNDVGVKISSEESKAADALIEKRIQELKAELERSAKILSNPNFLAKAPEAKVQEEKAKQAKYQEELDKYLGQAKN